MGCARGPREGAPRRPGTAGLEPSGTGGGWEGEGKPGGVVLAEAELVDVPRDPKVKDLKDLRGEMAAECAGSWASHHGCPEREETWEPGGTGWLGCCGRSWVL